MLNILSGVLSGTMFIIIGHLILTGCFEKNEQKYRNGQQNEVGYTQLIL